MNKEHHQNEIDQIRKHVKMLNITGGIAICALTMAGVLMASDSFEPSTGKMEASSRDQQVISEFPVSGTNELNEKPNDGQTGAANYSSTEKIDNEAIAEIKKSETKYNKATATKSAITFEEELQSFDASCNEGSIVFHWVTSGGAKYAYEIEKTVDQLNYEVFSRAPQPEKKDGRNVYSVEETATSGDDAYYRLRKVIGKGKYEYSETVKVKCSGKETQSASVDVFPNGNGSFRIVINTAIAGAYKVALSDVNETVLATEEFLAREGNNEFILSSTSITKGNYVLRVSNDSMVKERKVILK